MEYLFDNTLGQTLFFGCMFLILGLIMYLFPSKKINRIYGYYTAASIKSHERWDFSQKYSAKQRVISGLFMIVLSFLGKMHLLNKRDQAVAGFIIILIALIFVKVSTERAIKKQFKTQL